MTARDASTVLNTVVNNTGTIEAKSLSQDELGNIVLDGGTNGVVEMSGTLNASGSDTVDGGTVTLKGQYLSIGGTADQYADY